jgi:hypothetical protein
MRPDPHQQLQSYTAVRLPGSSKSRFVLRNNEGARYKKSHPDPHVALFEVAVYGSGISRNALTLTVRKHEGSLAPNKNLRFGAELVLRRRR